MTTTNSFDSSDLLECVNEIAADSCDEPSTDDIKSSEDLENNKEQKTDSVDSTKTKKRSPRKKKIEDKIKGQIDKDWICVEDFTSESKIDKFGISKKFIHVCNIIEPNKEDIDNNNLIEFDPVIEKEKWDVEKEWIYIFTIDDHIVKIGGTRNGLKKRTQSYMCGYYTKNRGYPGKMSGTNATIYNTFAHYLQEGCEIKMYAYEIPIYKLKTTHFNIEIEIAVQTFHGVESIVIAEYKKLNGSIPFLCKNSDPNYR